jgi:molecular chaperone GrpE
MSNEEIPNQWFEGIQLIQRKLESFLESEGVKIIDAIGFDFNPIEHEAVFYEETTEGSQGKVISVLTNGYKLHHKVLRPAQVTVGKQPDNLIN